MKVWEFNCDTGNSGDHGTVFYNPEITTYNIKININNR